MPFQEFLDPAFTSSKFTRLVDHHLVHEINSFLSNIKLRYFGIRCEQSSLYPNS